VRVTSGRDWSSRSVSSIGRPSRPPRALICSTAISGLAQRAGECQRTADAQWLLGLSRLYLRLGHARSRQQGAHDGDQTSHQAARHRQLANAL